jgi:hypothetical protein
MKAALQMYVGTSAEWQAANPRPYDAAWCFEDRPDGKRLMKVGNGRDRWNDLQYVDESYIKGLPEHFAQSAQALTQEAQARQAADTAEAQARQAADTVITQRVEAIEGKGVYLAPNDFGTASPSQEALTTYAMAQLGITDPLRISSATRVKNIFNGHLWMLNNTPDTNPPTFEWIDDGFETVGMATNGELGVVMGSPEPGKASVNAAGELVPRGPIGELHYSDIEPTPLELSLWRWLPTAGQLVLIDNYAELCARKWVGADANATADWWYKCDENGNRDVNGAYMRVIDRRGIFVRPAGQNSKYKMANNAPYDGGAIGAFIGDAIRNIDGYITFVSCLSNTSYGGVLALGEAGNSMAMTSGNNPFYNLSFNASRQVPVAPENRSASLSTLIYIAY